MSDVYRVLLDERWELDDLYEFSKAYGQVYALIYCFDSSMDINNQKRIDLALKEYPWNGGYSYVNIYKLLKKQITLDHLPRISSIQYASPGWIDLFLNQDVAIQIAKSLSVFMGSAVAATHAYKSIYSVLSEIKRDRKKRKVEEVYLTKKETDILIEINTELAKSLGFDNLQELQERTGNAEVTSKLLCAHYRRLKVLAELAGSGKLDFPINENFTIRRS